MNPRKLWLRVRLALWAARNPDRLTMLHFSMLRDAHTFAENVKHHRGPHDYDHGRAVVAERAARALADMPGADANRRAL